MLEPLRIAQLAPMSIEVGPETGGSIEQIVYLLTEELIRRGHEVTLFATGDSVTSAELRSVYPCGAEYDDDLWQWEFHESMHAAAAFEHASSFDVIHSHDYHFALPFTRLVRTPVLHTHHVLPDPDVVRAYAQYPEAHVMAISHHQRKKFVAIEDVPVVHHGIDTHRFHFNPDPEDYLLYLGRVVPEKGPLEAIQVARASGVRLVMAGPARHDYFEAVIRPQVDGRTVEYVGGVGVHERDALLADAAALLYPVLKSESFGMVMIEAMACGTPVAALKRGPVSEIVEEGVTGHTAVDVATLTSLVPATLELDRVRVREEAVRRFDYHRMVDEYEKLYQTVVLARQRRVS
jgi:glycosyltransferase involved in cell wall biosynthesis